jgi:cyanophycinase-like exopeptidase
MGTLTRLIHAVELGMVKEGWAIDENTTLVAGEGEMQVFGEGHAYWVRKNEGEGIGVSVYTAS